MKLLIFVTKYCLLCKNIDKVLFKRLIRIWQLSSNNYVLIKEFLLFWSSSPMICSIRTSFPYSARLKFCIQSKTIEIKTRSNINAVAYGNIRRTLFAVRLISRRWHRAVVSPLPCSGTLPKARSIVRPGTGNTHPYNRRGAHPNITGRERSPLELRSLEIGTRAKSWVEVGRARCKTSFE